MKWIKEHVLATAVLLIVIGISVLCVLAYNEQQPFLLLQKDTITLYEANIKVWVIGVIALALIVIGGVAVVYNESSAYYNRKSFFDTLDVKKEGKKKDGK